MFKIMKMLQLISFIISHLILLGHSSQIFFKDSWMQLNNAKFPSDSKPEKPVSSSWKLPSATMYIAISSFRDYRCPSTLYNIFSNAKHPERLSIGLIMQMRQETKDKNCIKEYCKLMKGQCLYQKNIRSMEMSALDSKGPSFSRYLHSHMVKNEEFFLQIDSHMDFVKNWDEILFKEWGATNNEYAILSTTPSDIALKDSKQHIGEIPYLCEAEFSQSGMIRNRPAASIFQAKSPILSPLWSSLFSFGRTHHIHRVPPDPNLVHAYDGVEYGMLARLWTRGYDIYAPSKIIVYHDYDNRMGPEAARRENEKADGQAKVTPVGWTDNGMSPWHKRKMFEDSKLRLSTLLNLPDADMSPSAIASLANYGLGSARTLQQLAEISGVDTRNKKIDTRCDVPLEWIPPITENRNDGDDAWGMMVELHPMGGSNIPLIQGNHAYIDMSDLWHLINENQGTNDSSSMIMPISNTDVHDNEEKAPQVNIPLASVTYSLKEWLRIRLGPDVYIEKAFKVLLLLFPLVVILCALGFRLLQGEHRDEDEVRFNIKPKLDARYAWELPQ